MESGKNVAALVGRVLLALMFVWAGFGKIIGYEGTAGWMASAGMPMVGVFLPLAILNIIVTGIWVTVVKF